MRTPLLNRRLGRGVTLIEVLVTMVIVAVGLLGLAGMQVRGLSIQKDAHGRALATQLALDLADRMRSNSGVAGNYAFSAAYPTGTIAALPQPDCVTATCTAAQQAQYDLSMWFTRLRGGALPGGWANIASVPGTSAWDITMMWMETGYRQDTAGLMSSTAAANLGSTCGALTVPLGIPAKVECMTIRVWP